MNKFDFYLPCRGCVNDKSVEIQPYEFRNFLNYHVIPILQDHQKPMIFWSEVQHGDGRNFYHLQIIVDGRFGPHSTIDLIVVIQRYATDFQTGPIMWNDQENCGIISKDDEEII